jgi:hypothetical protein
MGVPFVAARGRFGLDACWLAAEPPGWTWLEDVARGRREILIWRTEFSIADMLIKNLLGGFALDLGCA